MDDEKNNGIDGIKKPTSRIDEIRKRLYIKDDKAVLRRRFGVFHKKDTAAAENWDVSTKAAADQSKESKEKEGKKSDILTRAVHHKSVFKKFFLFSIIIFTGAMLYAAYAFFGGGNSLSTDNIAINVLGNTFTNGGEDLPLQIEVVNNNGVALELADLIIDYPKGSDDANPSNLVRTRTSLGTIAAGKSAREDTKVVLYGEEGSTRNINISLEYRVHDSNAIFTKARTYPVSISSAPIALSVDGPTETNPNQEVELKIKATLNATKPVSNMAVRVDYPPGFQFTDSDPKPAFSNSIWDLGDMAPGESKVVSLKGIIYGQDGEEKSFRIYTGMADAGDKSHLAVIYNSYLDTIAIRKPFLETHILVNGSADEVVPVGSGDSVGVEIPWSNNLPTRISDAQIIATISGNAYSADNVTSNIGFFNSNDNTITWDKNTVDDLSSIEPGESGTVGFTFTPLPLENSNHQFLQDPKIVISVSIKGTENDEGNITKEVNGSEQKTVRVTTEFQAAAQALYSTGPFTNTGPIPPHAGQTTTYTILWSLTNTSNRVNNAEVRTTLPTWVEWKGPISPTSANIAYNAASREVVWKVGSVERGAGLSGTSVEAGFQISFTPSTSQVDSVPQLIAETRLSGVDAWTGATLESVKNYLTTRLTNDPLYGASDLYGKVN